MVRHGGAKKVSKASYGSYDCKDTSDEDRDHCSTTDTVTPGQTHPGQHWSSRLSHWSAGGAAQWCVGQRVQFSQTEAD